MTYAFAEATVPKVNVIIGNAYGSAYIAMNSKSIGADMVYAWENAKIGMMDANLAARIMYDDADMETQKRKRQNMKKSNPVLNQRLAEDMLMRSSRLPIRENM